MTQLSVLYRLLVRRQLTTGRWFLFGGFGLAAMAVAWAINRSSEGAQAATDVTEFIYLFGIGLMVPVIALVLASSSLGELVEDETLVYVWHRPVARWKIAMAAWTAAASIALPFTAVPLMATAAIASGDFTSVAATGAATALAVVGYSGVFVLLGLVVRRALVWGLIYLVVWELFVSRAGTGAAKLSINTYPSSVLSRLTDIDLPLADRAMASGIIVPIAIAVAGIALAGYRLRSIDVA